MINAMSPQRDVVGFRSSLNPTLDLAEPDPVKSVIIIGAGFTGTFLALKLLASNARLHVHLVDGSDHVGRGLAYGACSPQHLLNVPVSRLEVGLIPSLAQWLSTRCEELDVALAESRGSLADAFVPRSLFGDYLDERLRVAAAAGPSLEVIRSEAVSLLELPRQGILLRDGRELLADVIVLATGNLPPKAPLPPRSLIRDARAFVADPWARGALNDIDKDSLVLLVGTGLTMVDTAIRLVDNGHRGPIHAVSRRGLTPLEHRLGGTWPPFIDLTLDRSPLALMRSIRAAAAAAMARGIPWQRVIDAIRPLISRIWTGWTRDERRCFLRHVRPYWDAHRYRLAPRVAERLQALVRNGQLTIWPSGMIDCRLRDGDVDVDVRVRGTPDLRTLKASRLINCTGPCTDFATVGIPLFASLRRRGLVQPDELGLGIETEDCAVCGRDSRSSSWLFVLRPLTRPAWWEITAVPEIAAQVDHLVAMLAQAPGVNHPPLARSFVDLGAGI